MHALFAATHPKRTSGMVWNTPAAREAWASDYPWGVTPQQFERDLRDGLAWGWEYAFRIFRYREAERLGIPNDAPELNELKAAATREFLRRTRAYARIIRNTATPDVAEQLLRIAYASDVRSVLPSVQAPVALVVGEADQVDEAKYIASLIPNAIVHVTSGSSGIAAEPFLRVLRAMVGAAPEPAGLDTVLSTVLFTDIVGSTEKQAALGDRGWRNLVLAHHRIVREVLSRWHGRENDTAGDGFYATFDGPARAIRAAREIQQRVQPLGIEIRAGVHTGECELVDGKCAGITVSIGARIAARANASEVLVSQTVKDLVAGSGLTFEDAGQHNLKGVPGAWTLYSVRT